MLVVKLAVLSVAYAGGLLLTRELSRDDLSAARRVLGRAK
jgi:hypothetical protein